MLQDPRSLLYRDDPDTQQARQLGQRTDQRVRLPGEDQVAQLRGGLLHQVAPLQLCPAVGICALRHDPGPANIDSTGLFISIDTILSSDKCA